MAPKIQQYIIRSRTSQSSDSDEPYIFRTLRTRVKELTMKGMLQGHRVWVYKKSKCSFTMYNDFFFCKSPIKAHGLG